MEQTNKIALIDSLVENISYETKIMDIPKELQELIIILSPGASKFVMHFVSKHFWQITQDNEKNRQIGISFITSFINNGWITNKINKVSELAANDGSLSILKWARENEFKWDKDTCKSAAHNGHLDVLKWLRMNGCSWDAWTCHYAAYNGHLEILKWAKENNCPWDAWTCASAARGGAKKKCYTLFRSCDLIYNIVVY